MFKEVQDDAGLRPTINFELTHFSIVICQRHLQKVVMEWSGIYISQVLRHLYATMAQ